LNGDLGKIYEAIHDVNDKVIAMQVEQKIRHEENRGAMKKLAKLPCQNHATDLRWIKGSVRMLWLVLIVGGLVTLFIKTWMGG